MAGKGVLTFKLLGDNKDLLKKVESAGGKLSTLAKNAAKVGAVAAGAAAVGLVKLGVDLDKAIDNIIIGTGASGEALEGLKNDFETVAANVPSSFGDVSTAIADVNTRLGLTGAPLQEMSTQFLDLSRITGTDVATNIASMTRVFGDAGIAVEDQSKALDTLFTASQASGIGIDQLSTTLVSFGAPMRNLGFSFEESTALLAKFDKEGVNTEAVMAGLKAGLGKMAKAGEEPAEALDRIVDSIKNAGSTGEANAIALEAFGQRAGPDMAAAIREGRFEIDDMMATLGDSEGSISDTAAATESWTEKLKVLKNKALMKIAPIAEKAFDAIGKGVAAATPFVEDMFDLLSKKLPPIMRTAQVWFERIGTVIATSFRWIMDNKGPVIGAFIGVAAVVAAVLVPAFIAWAASAGAAAIATLLAVAPFVAVAAAVAAVAGGLVWAYQNVDWFREAVDKARELLAVGFKKALEAGVVAVDAIWGAIQVASDWLQIAWDKTETLRSLYVSGFKIAIQAAKIYIETLWAVIKTAASWLQTAWDKTEILRSLYVSGFKIAVKAAQLYIGTLWAVIKTAASWLVTAWEKTESLRDLFANAFALAVDLAKLGFNNLKTAVEVAAGWVQTIWEKTDTLRGLYVGAFGLALSAVRIGFDGIKTAVEKVAGWVQTVWDKSDTLRGLFAGAFKTAINGVKGVFNDLKSAVQFVGDKIQWVIDKANSAIDLVRKIPGVGGDFTTSIGTSSIAGGGLEPHHSGGFIGNASGPPRDIPIMAQQGELMLSRDEVRAMVSNANGARAGESKVIINLMGQAQIEAIVSQRDADLLVALEAGAR